MSGPLAFLAFKHTPDFWLASMPGIRNTSQCIMILMQVVMANSSWTKNHLKDLWWKLEVAKVVFPPCDTENLQKIPRLDKPSGQQQFICSIAQFRPEKNHLLQLEAFALAKKELRSSSKFHPSSLGLSIFTESLLTGENGSVSC